MGFDGVFSQSPGLGGLDELTPAEELFLTSLAGLPYSEGDTLYYTGGLLTNLGIGSPGEGLVVNTGGTAPEWSTSVTEIAIGESVGSGTSGSMLFVDANGKLAQDNANFFIDNVDKRVGFGTISPSVKLEVLQSNDTEGFKVSGFDDMSGEFLEIFINSIGRPQMKAGNTFELYVKGNLVMDLTSYSGNFRKTMRLYSQLQWGSSADYSSTYNIDDDSLYFAKGSDSLTNPWLVTNGTNIGIGTPTPLAKIHIQTTATTDIGQIIQGVALQSGNLTEWQDSAGVILSYVDASGNIAINSDTLKSYYGAGQDMSITYDGIDGIIKTDEVAPSDLRVITGIEKTLELDTVVWDDHQSQLASNQKVNPSAHIVDDPAEASITFTTLSDTGDYIYMSPQMSHKWKLGTDIKPHLHWWQTTADQPNWLIQYRWQTNGSTKVTAWTDVALTSNAFAYVSGTLNQISYGLAITPPVGYGTSDIIQFRVIRDVANTSGAFAGAEVGSVDADAVSFDYHYEINTLGSRQEFIK